MPRTFTGVPECARCRRPRAEHDLDRAAVSELQVRLWRALGRPCARFTDDLAGVFAENQPAVSRWATARRRPDRAFRPGPAAAAAVPDELAARRAAAARRGADAVRAQLGIHPPANRE